MIPKSIFVLVMLFASVFSNGQSGFVKRTGTQFFIDDTPYFYIGTNYWYGGLIASRNDTAGLKRLRSELDFLVSKNVKNLRVLGGAEGEGLINGFPRVSPALQTSKGVFDTAILQGLDILLTEMATRNMKAVLFFSNNWEWSGGFLQYLNWNGLLPDSVMRRRMNWDEWRDYVSMFYSCEPCIADYKQQVAIIVNQNNYFLMMW